MDKYGKKTQDRISVIIPTYKREHLLRQCIDSIQDSSYIPFEIIICDDSPDSSCQNMIRNYFYDNVKYIRCGGKGQANARNMGAAKAEGEYLLFVDSDVLFFKDSLKELKRFILKGKQLILGNIIFPEIPISHYNSFTDLAFYFSQIKGEKVNFIRFLTCVLLIKKDIFLRHDGFDTDFSEYGFEDLELGYRIMGNNLHLSFAEKASALHYNNRSVMQIVKRTKNIAYASLLFFRKHPEFYNPHLLPIQKISNKKLDSRNHGNLKRRIYTLTKRTILSALRSYTDKNILMRLRCILNKNKLRFFNDISIYELCYLSEYYNIELHILPDTIISKYLSEQKIRPNIYKSFIIENNKNSTIEYYAPAIKKGLKITLFDIFNLPGTFLFLSKKLSETG